VNKGNGKAAGKPSVHVPQIARGAVLTELSDNRPQSLWGKGVIRQFFQRNPLEAHLTAIGRPPTTDGRKILTGAVEDGFDLMEAPMDAMHGVVLAYILPEVNQAAWLHPKAQFFEDLPADGVSQGFAMLLAAARQDQEFPFIRPHPHDQQVGATEDHRAGCRPDGRCPWTGRRRRGHPDRVASTPRSGKPETAYPSNFSSIS